MTLIQWTKTHSRMHFLPGETPWEPREQREVPDDAAARYLAHPGFQEVTAVSVVETEEPAADTETEDQEGES